MRFSVFCTLLVATFVVSCDSFISAETYSLADRTYDSTEISHLRGNGEIEEERLLPNVVKEIAGSVTKYGPKTEKELIADEKKILEKNVLETLKQLGRKHVVTKTKFPYKNLGLLLLGATVAAITGFTIHHIMSASYDPKNTAPPKTNTATSGST